MPANDSTDSGEENDVPESDDPLDLLGSMERGLLAYAGITEEDVQLSLEEGEGMEYAYAGIAGDEPTYQEAMRGPDKDK
jgi:hypothetical protein